MVLWISYPLQEDRCSYSDQGEDEVIQFNAAGEIDCALLRKRLDREICELCYSALDEATVYHQPICSICDVCYESIARATRMIGPYRMD